MGKSTIPVLKKEDDKTRQQHCAEKGFSYLYIVFGTKKAIEIFELQFCNDQIKILVDTIPLVS